MRRFATLLCFVSLLCVGHSYAADQAQRQALYERYLRIGSLLKGGAIQPHWMADGNSFWYAEGAPDNTVIYRVDPASGQKASLFDVPRLRRALAAALGHEPAGSALPFSDFSFVDGQKAASFQVENKPFLLALDTYAIEAVSTPRNQDKKRSIALVMPRPFALVGAPPVLEAQSPDGLWFASESNNNLFLRSRSEAPDVQLTTDGVKDYRWDIAVAKWSPDSTMLAVKKVDSRQVRSIPIVHWLKSEEEVDWAHYPVAGGAIERTEVYVVNTRSKRLLRIDVGPEQDHYINIVGWLPDRSELLLLKVDRVLQHAELLSADPNTGAARTILRESSNTFLFGGLNFFLAWPRLITLVNRGTQFIWMSERDGWNHLYLYDMHGTLVRQLTRGKFPVTEVVAVDEKQGWIYFKAHAEAQRPYDTHLYRVDFNGEHFARLTQGEGQHSIEFSPSRAFFLDTNSSVQRLPAVELRSADGKLVSVLSKANAASLNDIQWRPPEEFVVKAADQVTDLYGVLYKPHDFDPNHEYPVIDFIYAGPQTSFVPHTFLSWNGTLAQAMAHLGFIVFIVDGRGTPERGKQFQDVAYESVGRNEIPDHLATLRELAGKRPYMDLSRVGIMGHSYGGYFATRAIFSAPDVYRVAISSAQVVDLIVNPITVEPYMGLPEEHKAAYDASSNLNLAKNFDGKLLVIMGTKDVNVPFSHAMRLVETLTSLSKPYDLVVLPERDHALVTDKYWFTAVRRYLEDNLQGAETVTHVK